MAHKHAGGHRGRHHRRGGKTKGEHEYNAQGAPEMAEANDHEDGFKKGGDAKKKRRRHEKLKDGGHARGMEAKMKPGRRARRAAGGRTPYSSGHKTSMPANAGKTDTGHESQRPSEGG